MGWGLDGRRNQIKTKGRPMILRRTGQADLTLIAKDRAYQPHELLGGLQQGDLQVETTADEFTAAGWPVPPRKPDTVVIDGHSCTVLNCRQIREGSTLIGFSLWVRG